MKNNWKIHHKYMEKHLKKHNQELLYSNKYQKSRQQSKEKLIKGNKERWNDPEWSEKMRKIVIENINKYHESLSLEEKKIIKEKLSKRSKKMWEDPEYRNFMKKVCKERWTPEKREKQSIISSELIKTGKSKKYHGKKCKYKEIIFKSTWELKFAKILDENNILWKYEPKIFKIEFARRYTPDFKIDDLFIEIKPREFITGELLNRRDVLLNEYNTKLIILDEDEFIEFIMCFKENREFKNKIVIGKNAKFIEER